MDSEIHKNLHFVIHLQMNKEVFLKEKKNNQFSLNIKDGANNGKLEFSLAKWETKTLKKNVEKSSLIKTRKHYK